MAEPLENILLGKKTLELRTSANRTTGPIALIRKGSGQVVGVAHIGEASSPMSWAEFIARAPEHAVTADRLKEVFQSGYVYGWPLRGIQRLAKPVPYRHPPGAVKWVKLDDPCTRELRALLAGSCAK